MNIRISNQAAARLHALLLEEPDQDKLSVRLVPLSTGCGTPSFALELTEVRPGFFTTETKGIRFSYSPEEKDWLDGIVIDWNRETHKFSIFHPEPLLSDDCPAPDTDGFCRQEARE